MLKHFSYLNAAALGDYLSAVEGGQRGSLQSRTLTAGSRKGHVELKVAGGEGSKNRETEESLELTDTPQAQFERLQRLAQKQGEETGWTEVLDPDNDLASAGIGAMIQTECEIWVPDIVKALLPKGGLSEALETLDALEPFAGLIGADTSGLPSPEERRAFKGFAQALGTKVIIVGDFDGSPWHLAGQLDPDYVKGDVEGLATLVGKISAKWDAGQWKPLMALPGSSLLPRAERRALERKKPDDKSQDQFLEGPAVMLEILAIYR